MNHISEPIQNLIQAAISEEDSKQVPDNEPVISISTRTSRASFIYERMRNVVDYKEEHLIRRTAIERILKRLVSSGKQKNLVENLVHELIHARYLPNNTIPQKKLRQLEIIVDKYHRLLGIAPLKEVARKNTLASKIIGIMATEIDEFLMPPFVTHASINAMFEHIQSHLHVEQEIEPCLLAKQIYIASSRALYKNDDDTLRYHLLLIYYPHWPQADEDLIAEVGENLDELMNAIEGDLNHPLKEKLNPIARRQIAYFTILREIVARDPVSAANAMQDDQTFVNQIKQACTANYQKSRSTLGRSIGRSVIYLILTKFLLALILEIPVEYLLLGKYGLMPIVINFVFPPLLLTAIALSTKLPDDNNTEYIAQGIIKIVHAQGEIIQLSKSRKRSLPRQLIFVLLYALLFVISFGVLITVLETLDFTFISITIFLFFLSLVSLFAYRIRRSNQELIVTPPQKGIFLSLWNFLTIPVLHAGKWMSTKFAKINIFIFILDFVIEAPFKSFMKIVEEWTNFVHEKKEEI